jgi:hypothetical protein
VRLLWRPEHTFVVAVEASETRTADPEGEVPEREKK